MNKSEKFTIRVNFKPQQNSITQDEKKYQYHWGRIIGCSLLVFMAIGSSVYYGSYYFSQDNTDENQTIAAKTDSTEPTTVSQIPTIENSGSTTTANIPNETKTPINEPELAQLESLSIENISVDATPVNAIESELTKITSAIKQSSENTSSSDNTTVSDVTSGDTEQSPVIEDKINNLTANASTALNTAATEAPVIKTNNSSVLFTQVKTEIFSDDVERFTLSQNVINNEPVGTINDIVFDNNIATIYAFSQIDDSKNTTLYYQWSLNDEHIAKIRIGVIGNRWRSHSSKFIQSNMHGQWKVELQNQNDDVLAISQFKY
ncbi:DUF2914 domain-containing protein [Psychromonas sp. SP041]|uniref:DUF2914 domain-containing protein n=1 Tax=Psychromonas sp. SP041 TaxID=1365007 RepID=UPI0010C78909|nr:DUF2914 domain-containing protein [Psychromonas sp. SP041]